MAPSMRIVPIFLFCLDLSFGIPKFQMNANPIILLN